METRLVSHLPTEAPFLPHYLADDDDNNSALLPLTCRSLASLSHAESEAESSVCMSYSHSSVGTQRTHGSSKTHTTEEEGTQLQGLYDHVRQRTQAMHSELAARHEQVRQSTHLCRSYHPTKTFRRRPISLEASRYSGRYTGIPRRGVGVGPEFERKCLVCGAMWGWGPEQVKELQATLARKREAYHRTRHSLEQVR